MADKSTRVIPIPDPVHGYIPVEPRFLDIVDTPEFQRLRSIEQGDFRLAFPGARHDRFIHSLGTYHLASIFVERFFENLKEDLGKLNLDDGEVNDLKTTFRFAALLHDVGHAPFSHTTEHLFKESKDDNGQTVWDQLCTEVEKLPALEQAAADQAMDAANKAKATKKTKAYAKKAQDFADAVKKNAALFPFRKPSKDAVGAPHEIMSALLLVRGREQFRPCSKWKDVSIDLELAARMIIGHTYSAQKPADPDSARRYGIRDCLIQMLNGSVMDVDRLDYLCRDTQMSGYVNAPVDLDTLAQAVTAVEVDGWLKPAFRSSAISAIESMLHTKLSHDAWVLSHPAPKYDVALRQYCIQKLDKQNGGSYIPKVFSPDALSTTGVVLKQNGKHYRLLCDGDIITDIKALNDPELDELFTRLPGKRRAACWNSYYEFCHIFTDPEPAADASEAEKKRKKKKRLTPPFVYKYFSPLIKYLDDHQIFAFTAEVYESIPKTDPAADAAKLLHEFLSDEKRKYEEKHPDKEKKPYSVVLLDRGLFLTPKLKPAEVRILFTKKYFPKRKDAVNWTTYDKLRNGIDKFKHEEKYFYLFRHGGLGCKQLQTLCDMLRDKVPAAANPEDTEKNP